jgi:hypothetical protein
MSLAGAVGVPAPTSAAGPGVYCFKVGGARVLDYGKSRKFG